MKFWYGRVITSWLGKLKRVRPTAAIRVYCAVHTVDLHRAYSFALVFAGYNDHREVLTNAPHRSLNTAKGNKIDPHSWVWSLTRRFLDLQSTISRTNCIQFIREAESPPPHPIVGVYNSN